MEKELVQKQGTDTIIVTNIIKLSQDDSFNPYDKKYGCGCRGQGCGCNTDYGCCGNIIAGC